MLGIGFRSLCWSGRPFTGWVIFSGPRFPFPNRSTQDLQMYGCFYTMHCNDRVSPIFQMAYWDLQCLLACFAAWYPQPYPLRVNKKGCHHWSRSILLPARLRSPGPQAYLALFGAKRSLLPESSGHFDIPASPWAEQVAACNEVFLVWLSYTESHYFYFYVILAFSNIPVSHLTHGGRSTAFKYRVTTIFKQSPEWHREGEKAYLCLFYSSGVGLTNHQIENNQLRLSISFWDFPNIRNHSGVEASSRQGRRRRSFEIKWQRSKVSAQVLTAVWLWDKAVGETPGSPLSKGGNGTVSRSC